MKTRKEVIQDMKDTYQYLNDINEQFKRELLAICPECSVYNPECIEGKIEDATHVVIEQDTTMTSFYFKRKENPMDDKTFAQVLLNILFLANKHLPLLNSLMRTYLDFGAQLMLLKAGIQVLSSTMFGSSQSSLKAFQEDRDIFLKQFGYLQKKLNQLDLDLMSPNRLKIALLSHEVINQVLESIFPYLQENGLVEKILHSIQGKDFNPGTFRRECEIARVTYATAIDEQIRNNYAKIMNYWGASKQIIFFENIEHTVLDTFGLTNGGFYHIFDGFLMSINDSLLVRSSLDGEFMHQEVMNDHNLRQRLFEQHHEEILQIKKSVQVCNEFFTLVQESTWISAEEKKDLYNYFCNDPILAQQYFILHQEDHPDNYRVVFFLEPLRTTIALRNPKYQDISRLRGYLEQLTMIIDRPPRDLNDEELHILSETKILYEAFLNDPKAELNLREVEEQVFKYINTLTSEEKHISESTSIDEDIGTTSTNTSP